MIHIGLIGDEHKFKLHFSSQPERTPHLSGAGRDHPRGVGDDLVEHLEGVALDVGVDVREAAAQVGADRLAQRLHPDLSKHLCRVGKRLDLGKDCSLNLLALKD